VLQISFSYYIKTKNKKAGSLEKRSCFVWKKCFVCWNLH